MYGVGQLNLPLLLQQKRCVSYMGWVHLQCMTCSGKDFSKKGHKRRFRNRAGKAIYNFNLPATLLGLTPLLHRSAGIEGKTSPFLDIVQFAASITTEIF